MMMMIVENNQNQKEVDDHQQDGVYYGDGDGYVDGEGDDELYCWFY